MKQIIGAFSVLFILMLNLMLGAAILSVSAKAAEAKEYKAAFITEIENSIFNPKVILACKKQAENMGYQLEVKCYTHEEAYERCAAEILLKYRYEIPLLGISSERTTCGIAR